RTEAVAQQELAMSLSRNGARVLTIEHLLAALYATGVDNLRIELDGDEVPVFDGSSRVFLHLIDEAGVKDLAAYQNTLVVRKPVRVGSDDGSRFVTIEPADIFEVDYTIRFQHELVGEQHIVLEINEETFREHLASARTFCFEKDVEAMRARGLALGGSTQN